MFVDVGAGLFRSINRFYEVSILEYPSDMILEKLGISVARGTVRFQQAKLLGHSSRSAASREA